MTAVSMSRDCARITSSISPRPLLWYCATRRSKVRGFMKLLMLAAVAAVAALLSVAHAQEEVKGVSPASSAPAPSDASSSSPADTAASGAPEVGSGGMPDTGAGAASGAHVPVAQD